MMSSQGKNLLQASPPFRLSEGETVIIRKCQVHNHGMAETFRSGRLIVNDQVILLILIILLILECKAHSKDSLLCIRIAAVRDVRVLIENLFNILGDKVHLICGLLNGITDRIGLDEIQGRNQVRDLLDDADQRNLSGPPLHSIPRSTESREARSAKKRLEYNIVSSKWLSFTSGFGNGA